MVDLVGNLFPKLSQEYLKKIFSINVFVRFVFYIFPTVVLILSIGRVFSDAEHGKKNAIRKAKEKYEAIEDRWTVDTVEIFLIFRIIGPIDRILSSSIGKQGIYAGVIGADKKGIVASTPNFPRNLIIDNYGIVHDSENGIDIFVVPITADKEVFSIVYAHPSDKNIKVTYLNGKWNAVIRSWPKLISTGFTSVIWLSCFLSFLLSLIMYLLYKLDKLNKAAHDHENNVSEFFHHIALLKENHLDINFIEKFSSMLRIKSASAVKLNFEPVVDSINLLEVIQGLCFDWEIRHGGFSLEFQKKEIIVSVDFSRLVFILTNLFQNAKRYGTGEVEVCLSKIERQAVVKVSNLICNYSMKKHGLRVGLSNVKKYCDDCNINFIIYKTGGKFEAQLVLQTY